jgi:hypothetical protein
MLEALLEFLELADLGLQRRHGGGVALRRAGGHGAGTGGCAGCAGHGALPAA